MIRDPAALPVNLRYLCARHPSVADICRRIGINRQQFNKYLAGASLPSPRNLARICGFFGLEPNDLYLPRHDFAALTEMRAGSLLSAMAQHANPQSRDPAASVELERYCGVYQTYQYAPYAKSSILVGLCQISRRGEQFLSKYVEVTEDETTTRRLNRPMYGLVTLEGGFLYILDRRAGENPSYSLTVLFPNRGVKVGRVTGMTLSISQHLSGAPYAANIVYEKLAGTTQLLAAARRMRLYDRNTPAVSDEIKHIITNRIREGQHVLSHYFI
ncbi:MAG: helix-turn-helix transcriptional regulator [Rhodobacterales bacterium]|nr:helix-turn-helix transcriptional regulator [Rhodobacterales bacterium]